MEIKNRNLKLKMENENENQYSIWDLDLGNQIGEINFKFENQNRILNLEFLTIYKSYRNRNYGVYVIEYLKNNYEFECIKGESLRQAKGFWIYVVRNNNAYTVRNHKLSNTIFTFYIFK